MENNNYPQTYPSFQYFPPPLSWIDPNSVSSDDNNTPTWVIVGVVIVVVMFCGFLFYYIRRREKKIWKKVTLPLTPRPLPSPPPKTPPPSPPEKMPPLPPLGEGRPLPPTVFASTDGPFVCERCKHGRVPASFKYKCPDCGHWTERGV